ncbi:MAG: DoxX family membrane protein [Phycisphaerales bacterium]
MAFKHAAGAGIIPTLSRLVLAAAFVTVGYNKIFKEATFDAAEATTLTALGIDVEPVGAASVADPAVDPAVDPATGAPDGAGAFIEPARGAFRLASVVTPPIQVPPPVENAAEQAAELLRQANENAEAAAQEAAGAAEAGAAGAAEAVEQAVGEAGTAAGELVDQAGEAAGAVVEGAQDAAGTIAEGAQDAAGAITDQVGDAAGDAGAAIAGAVDDVTGAGADDAAGADSGAVAAEPLPEGAYTARALHKITLLCEANKIPAPTIMAWVAGVTEFIGGIALLVGLLTRFWSMGLMIAMGTAFYLVSMQINGIHLTNPFTFAETIGQYNAAAAQLALGILALGLVLTGPGPISLDRLVFPPDTVKAANAASAAGLGTGAALAGAAQGPTGQVLSDPYATPQAVPGVAIPPGVQTPYAQPSYAAPDPYAQAPAAGQPAPAQPTGGSVGPADVPLQGAGGGMPVDPTPPASSTPDAAPGSTHGPTAGLGPESDLGGDPPRPRPETSFGGEGRPL